MRGYSIEEILIGTYYRSNKRNLEGRIIRADKRDNVQQADNAYSVLVQSDSFPHTEFWATIFIDED